MLHKYNNNKTVEVRIILNVSAITGVEQVLFINIYKWVSLTSVYLLVKKNR